MNQAPYTDPSYLASAIFELENPIAALALDIFRYQYNHNQVYKAWANHLHRSPEHVSSIEEIPFLPIEFFKSHTVVCTNQRQSGVLMQIAKPSAFDLEFRSSGTTGQHFSRHYVLDKSLYEKSFQTAFARFYGNVKGMRILALLPGYLERGYSSLVYMVRQLIEASGHPESGFFLDDIDTLKSLLKKKSQEPTLLIGVSFALLDLAESSPMRLENTIVMETGGMKGRRKEPVREELHRVLCSAFGVVEIHSEYGMTELLSQAYAQKNGRFECPPWMDIKLRDVNDPVSPVENGRTGAINIIDLANVHSCCFIATSDLGLKHLNGHFEVLGRMDYSDIRGCNLMLSELSH